MIRFMKTFLYTILFFLLILLFIQNSIPLSQEFSFHLNLYVPGLNWETIEMPLFFLVMLIFVLGCLFTMFPFFCDRLSLLSKLRKTDKKIALIEKELNAYRQRPLTAIENKEETAAEK